MNKRICNNGCAFLVLVEKILNRQKNEKKSCKIEKIPIFAEIIGLKYPIM